ncbi:potassium channel family protein [Sedimentitalea nanhaiensis]|uniref:Ion channel n=1 Tax=Sedimentitalea nanhaiensis TaxID=999627 RepID=A0A1I6YJ76_9RHOB|nr:potassium channel family protein [Sedimentitalea nanhaiensis]SFT50374.1 Ion channel [Sedimentitalea nanhaiensis]
MRQIKAQTVIISLVGIVLSGTVFFHLAEGWSWLDSYFFTVVTISTVGYGSLVPTSALGKLATTGFIFVGLGIFAVAIQQFAVFQMRKREEHTEWLIGHLGHRPKDSAAANEDDRPTTPVTDQQSGRSDAHK